MLATGLGALAVCVAIASGLAISARTQSAAQPDVKRGVEAFNSGDFRRAVEYFERAVSLDANYTNARLHLANALIRDFIVAGQKGADESAPAPLLQRAREQFSAVLPYDPKNVAATFGLVALKAHRGFRNHAS